MIAHPPQQPPDHDVVVIGAGPAGLVAAVSLARQGVDVLLLDKRSGVSARPRAVGVSVRQMEVFRGWGLEPALRAGADDVDLSLLRTATAADARSGIRLPINVPDVAQSSVVSTTTSVRVPQDHLERVLVSHLVGQVSAEVRRGWEVTGVEQDETGVRLSVRADVGPEHTITSAFVIAADGARSSTRAGLGISVAGPDRLMAGVSAEFRAPIWPVLGEHRHALYSISEPRGAGVLIPAGTDERWQFGVVVEPDDDVAAHARPHALADRIRHAVGVPDLPVEIVQVTTFAAGAQLAERFQLGRVFLAGDAAHRVTPRGGNGLAMAVRDGLALGWRLAWVVRGWAPPSFLATYEEEMRPPAADDVARAADPEGGCHPVLTELLHDLGGRLQHAWVDAGPPDGDPVSTLDLLTDGLTLFVGHDAVAWRLAAPRASGRAPVAVVELPRAAGRALGLRPDGALLVRPDGVPVARWYSDGGCAAERLDRAIDDLLGPPASAAGGSAPGAARFGSEVSS